MGNVPSVPAAVTELATREDFGPFQGVFHAHSAVRTHAQNIYMYTKGGVFLDGREAIGNPGDGATVCIRWDQVTGFIQMVVKRQGLPPSTTHQYIFILRDLRQHKVTSSTVLDGEMRGFAAVADPLITAAQLEPMARRLKRGESISFGPFRAEPDGIRIEKNDRTVPWADITEITITKAMGGLAHSSPHLNLMAKNKKAHSFQLEKVFNRSAFCALAKMHGIPVTGQVPGFLQNELPRIFP